jgi:cyclic pyranopterin phosphate synthase
MPPEGVVFKSHEQILSYEDMVFFVGAAVDLGITKVRITGGEPLARKGLTDLVRQIRAIPEIRDVSLTTNGVMLPRHAQELKDAGLNRVNISVDSLDPERYRALTRGGSLEAGLAGVEAALETGLYPVKINAVMMPDLIRELPAFVEITRHRPLHVRFIEWMPVGEGNAYCAGTALTKERLMAELDQIGAEGAGELKPVASPGGWGPARYYRYPGFEGTIGFIGSMSDHFCGECNRLRLTADGKLKNCLFSSHEVDAKPAMQARDRDAVLAAISESLGCKTFDKNVIPGRTARNMSQVGG